MARIVSNYLDANCITHSGTMHADEVFSTAFLELYKGDIRVFRTSSIDSLKINDDVLVYDIGRGEFDHHQNDALKRDDGITYCSFGLLWKKFGRDFLNKYGIELVDDVWNGIDKDLVEEIDADDNGVFPRIDASYKVKTIPGVIKLFNPSFDSGQIESEQFIKAVSFAKEILEEEILYINGKCLADKQVKEIISELNGDEKYIVLDKFLPYEESIITSELCNNILYVAYPSNRGGYAIKTVPKSIEDRSARMLFPAEWAGLEGDSLEEVSNISGLSFCHTGRFILTCNNLDSVYNVLDYICK